MTYSATDTILNQALERGDLVQRFPLVKVDRIVRRLYVTPAVANALDGNDEKLKAFPMREIEKKIYDLSAGYYLTGSLIGSSSKKPDVEKLTELDEVWVLCARKPLIGQIRLLGRFLEEGVFIGLEIYDRGFLGDRENYKRLAAEVPDRWKEVLPGACPFRAADLKGYLGGVVRDVDDPKQN